VNARASAAGTGRYAAQWESKFVPDFFRTSRAGLNVSSVALGTYLGDSDDATDALYAEALRPALCSGVNMVDTSINYCCQRSERVTGCVLQELIVEGLLRLDDVIICTKAG